jgi:hypothetical protein
MDLPRVTEILSVIVDPDWEAFKESVGPSRFREVLDRAADRGTKFHGMAEMYLRGEIDRDVLKGLRETFPDVAVNLEAFLQYADDNIEELIASEVELTHKLGFMGHPDIIARMKSGKCACLDIKYVSVLSKKTALQTIAYSKMAEEKYSIKITYRAALQFNGNGFKETVYKDHATDWGVFMSALNIYNYTRRK